MIKILNPQTHSTTVKTAEIMSKYRPIAPKPETPVNDDDPSSSMSQKISQSPYLRNLWPQLQARPTRTRKRGRAGMLSPPPLGLKRSRAAAQHVLGFSTTPLTHAESLSFQSFPHFVPNLSPVSENVSSSGLVTLSLLPCSPVVEEMKWTEVKREEKGINLNKAVEVPEEKDFLQLLQVPICTTSTVIAPQPVRPVGSSISVGRISEDPSLAPAIRAPKKPEEVEEEVESESLPAVISDSNNRVRLVNSAYKEMVGQPECSWLGSMVTNGTDGRSGCRRICGEVMLQLCNSRIPVLSNAFSCWVRIEWGRDDNKKCLDTFCDVNRLACKSKDYQFTWRFHASSKEASQSSCNA